MRSPRLLVLLVCLAVIPLRAADRSLQVFGGLSPEILRSPDGAASTYRGWNASVAGRLFWRVSLVADFAGHYGQEYRVVDNHVHTFLSGPRVSLRNGRIAPFVHALFGVSRLRSDSGGPIWSDSAFTLAAGGGVDLRLMRHWSARIVQIDYLRRAFFGEPPHAGRLSAGVVYRFGE